MILSLFEIKSVDGKHYVNVPYDLKDELKSAVSSAKWDSAEKCWYVGPRSLKKLEAWIADNDYSEEKHNKDKEERRAAFVAKMEGRRALVGKTYMIKEELGERFDAIFHDGAWHVTDEVHEEAQAFVDANNANAITKERIAATGGNVQKMLELIESASKNFKNDGCEYIVEDEIGELIRYGDEAEAVYRALSEISEDLFFFSQESQEVADAHHSFYDNLLGVLRLLDIPQHICIETVEKNGVCVQRIGDYAKREAEVISDLISGGHFHKTDIKEASKLVAGVGGYGPSFCFKSLVTGVCYECPGPDILERQNSSRVKVYDATNIYVLHSGSFETHMSYWQNRARSRKVK